MSSGGDTLVEALLEPSLYPHPVDSVELIETHISWVFLAGEYAYKVKKPLELGFLDFSTLAKRLEACREELRLNRRYAPQLYLDVVTIAGPPERPSLDRGGEPLEYAVRMRRFRQEARLDHLLESGSLTDADIDVTARRIAAFHGGAPAAGADVGFGDPDQVHAPVRANFRTIGPLLKDPRDREDLAALEEWAEASFSELRDVLAARKRDGFVRECHGDLHLGNLTRLDDGVVPFDCIEFNPALRWIDVVNEVAFLMMDLRYRGRVDLAYHFMNVYLEHTGDYAGLRLLPYYLAYRAMVRAKIAMIRYDQEAGDEPEGAALKRDYREHAAVAAAAAAPARRAVILTCGVSGSGKSRVAGDLAERLPAFRVRSDVERKRLFGLGPLERSDSAPGRGLYTAEANRRTYDMLEQRAREVVGAGYSVILDATFLKRDQRRRFHELAAELAVPSVVVACHASEETLRERVARRSAEGRDASEADLRVLEGQLGRYQPPTGSESAVMVDTETPRDLEEVTEAVRRLL